jgi:hypothetical protein
MSEDSEVAEVAERIEQFWSWFADNATALAEGDAQADVDTLYDEITKINEGLGVETADIDGGGVELTLTCYADPELMELVEQVYEAAPKTEGWRFVCYKQARGEPFVLHRAGVDIDSTKVIFDPLSSPQDRKALGMRLFVPDEVVDHEEEDDILWDIVISQAGEEVAAAILHVKAAPMDKASGDELPLEELGGYVKWHVKRHHGKQD